MVVVKTVMITMVITVIKIDLRIFKTNSIRDRTLEAWDDYRISKVQSRFQL